MSDTENRPSPPSPLTMYKKNWPYLLSGLVLAVFLRWQDAEHGRPVTLVEVLSIVALIPISYWVIKRLSDPALPGPERAIWIFVIICLVLLCAWVVSILT